MALCRDGFVREGVHLLLLPGLLTDVGPQAVGTVLHQPQVQWVFTWGDVCVLGAGGGSGHGAEGRESA